MSDADFSKLTEAQIDCMNYHAFNGYAGGRRGSVKTLKTLVDIGFLAVRERKMMDRSGKYIGTDVEIEMPIAIHIRWCEWVSKDADIQEEGLE